MAMPDAKPILIRDVWASNLEKEFLVIRSIVDQFPYISMDTEFPGTVVNEIDGEYSNKDSTPQYTYKFLKANVDVLKLIQVGLTFTDSDGNLPDLASDNRYIWQFNFRDFDVHSDRQAPDSINLLWTQGINFEMNRVHGIDSVKFTEFMMSSGIVCNEIVNWIVFQGGYDFGLLVKILTRKILPDTLPDFMEKLKVFFGEHVYDIRCLMKNCDRLEGGLQRVASTLEIARDVGVSHQAGSDSLLTWRVFRRISSLFFTVSELEKYAGLLFGLET